MKLFRVLMRALVGFWAPSDCRETVVGDLEEEWHERIRPSRGRLRSLLWYMREGGSLIVAFQRDRMRDLMAGGSRPGTGGESPGRQRVVTRTGHTGGDGWRDLRQVVRGLRRTPAFTGVAVLTLGIGMAGTLVMFALADAAYLRRLPYPAAEQLARVYTGYENDRSGRNAISPLTWQDVEERPDLAEAVEVWEPRNYHLSEAGTVRRVEGVRASAGLLSLMGATPVLGRLFVAEDASPGRAHTVILSNAAWLRLFGGDAGVVGRTLVLDDEGYEVVGVLEPGFDWVRGGEVWVPLSLGPEWYVPDRRGWEFLRAVVRLRDGVTAASAASGLTDQLAREAPDRVADTGQRVNVVPLREDLVGEAGTVILVLLAAVGMVLLIGCANVMNLVLARAERRRREFALRRALGAGAGRLARLVVVETLALSVAGGVLGVALAVPVLRFIALSPPESVADLGSLTIGWEVLLVAAGLSLATGLVFGMAPVAGALRTRAGSVLDANGRGAIGTRSGNRIRAGLVVAEVALAVVLVFGVAVTTQSFRRLTAVAPGFEPGSAIAFNLELPATGLSPLQQVEAWQRVLGRVRAVPGVSGAGLTYALPLTGVQWSASFELLEPDPSLPESALGGNMRPVSPGWFRLLGIPLLEGRALEDTDAPGAPAAVVVDETLAKRVWPGRSPVGERVQLGALARNDGVATVVGVVGNVRDRSLSLPPSAHVYFAAWQSPQRRMVLVAQPAREGLSLAPAIRAAIREVEPRIPVYDVRPVSSVIAGSLSSPRLSLLLLVAFATVALLLAAIGVYGVLSYTVALRTREIGTRIALGATPSGVHALVLRQLVRLWLLGAGGGAVIAFGIRSVARGLLFEVDPGNPAFIGTAIAGLGLVAFTAGLLPARRAARMDCVEALRQD